MSMSQSIPSVPPRKFSETGQTPPENFSVKFPASVKFAWSSP